MEMNVSECFPESKPKIVTGRCMRLKLMLGCKIQLLMLYSLSVNPPHVQSVCTKPCATPDSSPGKVSDLQAVNLHAQR